MEQKASKLKESLEEKSLSNQISGFMTPTKSSILKHSSILGKDLRKTRDTGPGPADYTVFMSSGTGCKIGKGGRNKNRLKKSIGPGDYDIPSTLSKIGVIIQPRRKKEVKLEVPGPGSYSPRTLEKKQGAVIGKAEVVCKRSQTPGPGSYNLRKSNIGRSAVTYLSTRPPFIKVLDNPGPGSYEWKPRLNTPTVVISNKGSKDKIVKGPGPGSYSPNLVSNLGPSWRFGTSPKKLDFIEVSSSGIEWFNKAQNV